MSMAPISRLSPPSPQLANQRTGGVFNLRSSEEEVSSFLSRELNTVLLDHNILSNTGKEYFERKGTKAVKVFQHPEKKNTSVILTNEHARKFPENDNENVSYVRKASEEAQTFSVETGQDLNSFLKNTLFPDLGLRA